MKFSDRAMPKTRLTPTPELTRSEASTTPETATTAIMPPMLIRIRSILPCPGMCLVHDTLGDHHEDFFEAQRFFSERMDADTAGHELAEEFS